LHIKWFQNKVANEEEKEKKKKKKKNTKKKKETQKKKKKKTIIKGGSQKHAIKILFTKGLRSTSKNVRLHLHHSITPYIKCYFV